MSRDGNIALAAPAEGGCLCGAIRYRVTPCSGDSGYCHCRTCQRSAGAPAMAWLSIPRTHLSLTQGTPKRFRSSSHAERHFCDACGTQLFFSDDHATSIDINIPTLDNPDLTPPRYHIWRMSRLSWFDTADTLPRFDDRGMDP